MLESIAVFHGLELAQTLLVCQEETPVYTELQNTLLCKAL